MDKWIISLDIDGTTLIDKNRWKNNIEEAHEQTLKAINFLQQLGHYVVINTGRSMYGAKKIYDYLNLKSYAITSAGALISNPHNSKDIFIENSMSEEIIKIFIEEDIIKNNFKEIFIDGIEYCHTFCKVKTPFVDSISVNRKVKIFDNLNFNFNPQNVVISLNLDNDSIQSLIKELNLKYKDKLNITNFHRKGTFAIEINNSISDKGDAVLTLAKNLNIPKERTIAFGDQENDIDMLKKVGVGVAMKNAIPELKKVANKVTCKDNNDGGVGYFLNEFFKLNL